MQVTFQDNTAVLGALYLFDCTAKMTGMSSFLSNIGTGAAGAVYAVSSTLDIEGPLCAQDNAGPLAGFLFSFNSRVTFHQPDTARINNNTPVDIYDVGSEGSVFCGTSTIPWASGPNAAQLHSTRPLLRMEPYPNLGNFADLEAHTVCLQ